MDLQNVQPKTSDEVLAEVQADLMKLPSTFTPFKENAENFQPYQIPRELRDWVMSMVQQRQLKVKLIRKRYTDFSTAGLTLDVNLFKLPKYCEIITCWMNVKTAFAGGGIGSYTMSVGPDGTETTLLVAQSVASTGLKKAVGTDFTTNRPIFSTTTSTQIQAKATTTVANLDQVTGGVVDFFFLYYQYDNASS